MTRGVAGESLGRSHIHVPSSSCFKAQLKGFHLQEASWNPAPNTPAQFSLALVTLNDHLLSLPPNGELLEVWDHVKATPRSKVQLPRESLLKE